MTPAELKTLRRDLRNKLLARRKAKCGPQNNYRDMPLFDVTPVGEYIYHKTSGTLTELTQAGICCACLGCGRKKDENNQDKGICECCFGSGDYDPPADEWEEKLRKRLPRYLPFRRDMTREEFVDYCVVQICLYGGDNTWELLSHYGESLKQHIDQIIVE